MKKILHPFVVFLFISVTFSSYTKAQQTGSVTQNKYEEESSWKAAKMNAEGTNNINGVEFYRRSISTATKSAVVLKVVNTNPYAVKIQWEKSAGEMIEIIVSANSSAEGNADSVNKESDESKLVFPKTLTDEAKQLMHSTISVIQVK